MGTSVALRDTIMTDGGTAPSRAGSLSAAFVSPGWPPDAFSNGIIPYVANITDEMRLAGHRATVITQRLRGMDESADVRLADASRVRRSLAVKVADALMLRVAPRQTDLRKASRALIGVCRQLIAEQGLQIVEIEESLGFCRLLQQALPIPVVVRLHGPWFLNGPLQNAAEDEAFRWRVDLEKKAIASAEAITAPSLDVLERTRSYYGLALEKARVIHPSTAMVPPEARWKPDAAEAGTIVFVGRFDRHKGGDLVIDAFAEVARRDPSARLIFIGPDKGLQDDEGRAWTIEDYLRHRLTEEAIASRVQWLGAQPGALLADFRRKGAVVVVGSRYDNFPVTVLEAMALGCPLVAPRIGGIPEIVEDGVNGRLYKSGDSADMAAKLLEVLGDPAVAAKLGAQAAVDCERRHDPALLARNIADFFFEVIEARSQSRKDLSR